MSYPSYKWKYVSHRPRVTMIVFARERKTADEIIALENVENIAYLRPARLFFKKRVYVRIPPYELEQEQLTAAEHRLAYRKEYLITHPEARGWLAKHE